MIEAGGWKIWTGEVELKNWKSSLVLTSNQLSAHNQLMHAEILKTPDRVRNVVVDGVGSSNHRTPLRTTEIVHTVF